MPKIGKRTGKIPQITQIVHNDILVKEIKSAHDHLRCNIVTSMEATETKKPTYPSSKCYGHMKDHVITEGSGTHRGAWNVSTLVMNEHVFQPKQRKESVCMRIEFNSRRISWDTNMPAVPLFGDISMATVTSREKSRAL